MAGPWRGLVQLRAHGTPVPAAAHLEGDRLVVIMDSAVTGVAPGQAVVLYEDTRVVGGATIATTT